MASKLEEAVDAANKRFGAGSVMLLGDSTTIKVDVIPTGSLALDIATGIGGWPRGRTIEIAGPESSGKTTLAIHAIAETQKMGLNAFFIDAEHAFDKTYAAQVGVDVDKLMINQPECGEDALEIADMMIKSGEIALVVIDSVATLVPRAELDGEMGENKMGLHARLMSQAMRKLVGATAKTNTCVIFINQLRDKIGVFFGCFSYNNLITLADGSKMKIGEIVARKLNVNVQSYNFRTNKIEIKRVVNWFRNGKASSFIKMESKRFDGGSKNFIEGTENHLIFTNSGMKHLGNIKVGDVVKTKANLRYNRQQYEVALGSILGDGSLRCAREGNVQLRIGHGKEQIDYCNYKKSIFSNIVSWEGVNSKMGYSFDIIPTWDLANLYRESYFGKKRMISKELLDNITLEGVAIWYMDDASFDGSFKKWGNGKTTISVRSYEFYEIEKLIGLFVRLNIPIPTIDSRKRLTWYGKNSYAFQDLVKEYIIPEMQYKIHPKLRGKYNCAIDKTTRSEQILVDSKVTSIKTVIKNRAKYDLEVEDNHNYFCGGVLVHNSPEVTTGGNALKFYSSIRVDIRKSGGAIKNKDGVAIENHTKVKIVKNKLAPPFTEAEFDIEFGVGISKAGEIVDIGTQFGVIKRSGAWYSYGEVKLGNGKPAAKEFLLDNPGLMEELEAKIKLTIKGK